MNPYAFLVFLLLIGHPSLDSSIIGESPFVKHDGLKPGKSCLKTASSTWEGVINEGLHP